MNRRAAALLVVLLGSANLSCEYTFAKSAPPVERTVALIERDPGVAAALGKPVSVSLAVARTFRRRRVDAWRGNDSVYLDTMVKGSRGTAELTLSASNQEGQGWAGSFALEQPGRRVVRNGKYVTEGARALLKGDFGLDGAPRPQR